MPPKRPIESVEGSSEVKQPDTKQSKKEFSVEAKQLGEDLYNYCNNRFTSDDTIYREDLLESNLFPDKKLETMRPTIQYLIDRKLFKMWKDPERGMTWKIIDRAQAAKYVSCTMFSIRANGCFCRYTLLSNSEEHLIYTCIENAGTDGIWSASIKNKTGVIQMKVPKVLSSLASKGLIKFFKSPDRPNAKMCILKDLEPANVVARGPFYTDGELDEELVRIVGRMVLSYVAKRSFIAEPVPTSPVASKKGKEKMTKEAAESLRDSILNEPASEEHRHRQQRSKSKEPHHKYHLKDHKKDEQRHFRYLPHPPGFDGYPTLEEITQDIEEGGAIKIELGKVAIEQILNVLVWDNLVYRVIRKPESRASSAAEDQAEDQAGRGSPPPTKIMYRAFKNITQIPHWNNGKEPEDSGNGLTEIPCGRCPVIDICEEGGVVNVRTCTYWDEWLKQLDF